MAATRDGMTLRLGNETIHFPSIFTEAAGRSVQKDILLSLKLLLESSGEKFESKDATRAITNIIEKNCLHKNLTKQQTDEVFDSWITPALKMSLERMTSLIEKHFNKIYKDHYQAWNNPDSLHKLAPHFEEFEKELQILVQAQTYLVQNIFSAHADHTRGPYQSDFEFPYKKVIRALLHHCNMTLSERIYKLIEKEITSEVSKCLDKYVVIYLDENMVIPDEQKNTFYCKKAEKSLDIYQNGHKIASISESRLYYKELDDFGNPVFTEVKLNNLSQEILTKMKSILFEKLTEVGLDLYTDRKKLLDNSKTVIMYYLNQGIQVATKSAILFDLQGSNTTDEKVMTVYSEILKESTQKCYVDLRSNLISITHNNKSFIDSLFFQQPSDLTLNELKKLIIELDLSNPNWDDALITIRALALKETTHKDPQVAAKMKQILTCIESSPVWKNRVQPLINDMDDFQELHNSLLTSARSLWGKETTPSVIAIKQILEFYHPNTSVEKIYQFFSDLSMGISKQIDTYKKETTPEILSVWLDKIEKNPTYQKYCERSTIQATVPCKVS